MVHIIIRMPNYMNTKIYQIRCKNSTITSTYIGHTTNEKSRTAEHKYNCNNKNSKSYDLYLYSFIRNNGGWGEWEVIIIEEYPCNSRREALSRENYYVHLLNSTLNQLSPILDLENVKQYKERKSLEQKEKTKIKLKKKKEERIKYLEENKEEIEKHKIEVRNNYAMRNRERINKNMREYNKKNNEKIKENLRNSYRRRCLKNKSALIIQRFFKIYIKNDAP